MSREIKFRAWIKNKNRIENCIEVNPFYVGDCDRFHWKHDEVELMQYVGLKDKNDKEIYEGDIIKALNRNYDCEDNKEDYFQLFEVAYLNGCYMFGNWNAHEFFNKFMYIEAMGNKFENPDLLQSK
jgi:uncharacterized phage protein (TIGR01671 family)